MGAAKEYYPIAVRRFGWSVIMGLAATYWGVWWLGLLLVLWGFWQLVQCFIIDYAQWREDHPPKPWDGKSGMWLVYVYWLFMIGGTVWLLVVTQWRGRYGGMVVCLLWLAFLVAMFWMTVKYRVK